MARAIPGLRSRGVTRVGRPQALVQHNLRDRLAELPGVRVSVGQPIAHRLDHMLSGVRAQIVVKVLGPDLHELRELSQDVLARMSRVSGVVDVQIEPQVEISQVRLRLKRTEAARYGLAAGDVARLLETAYKGRVVSRILDEERSFALVVWY